MNFTILGVLLLVALVAAVAYAALTQSIENNRKKKERVNKALQTRYSNFSHILEAFPDGFLSAELQLLVCRCIIDDLEKLAQLEPEDTLHTERLAHFSQFAENIKLQGDRKERTVLNNPAQIKEIRHHLGDLGKFIQQLQRRGIISGDQLQNYQMQIKSLLMQVSLDTYALAAKRAIERSKYRLAHHYYDLSKKILMKEGSANFANKIHDLDEKIKEIEPLLEQEINIPATEDDGNSEWAKFNEDEGQFKKNLYDD